MQWVHDQRCGRLWRGGLCGLLLAAGAGPSLAQTNALSLARAFPLETLRQMLVPIDRWRPFPRYADHAAWQALPSAARQNFLKLGEESLHQPLPALPATLYLEFAREGNRSRFEAPYGERRKRLHCLVVAECVEAKGRFLDAIANTLWAICEESTWCLPAHVGVQKAGSGLPDVTEPIVDLFAGETAVSVAWTLYLVGPELDRISPQVRRRAELDLQRRVLTPVLERDFAWMGFGARSREQRPNNWNPWINSSVLAAALATEADPDRRCRLVHKVLRSLDCFLGPYPADGSCDEGPGYWTRAGGSVLDNLDLLASATAGKLDVFGNPLIQEIGRFIYRAHICGDYYVDIGDCSARLEIDRDLAFRYGQRIHDPQLQALGTHDATVAEVLRSAGTGSFGRLLWALFDLPTILAQPPAAEPRLRDVWLGSEDMQLMAARGQDGSCAGLYLAAWGGHNAQSHNHNDVGNIIVFANGQPVLVDVGVATYTRKTFSRQRYDLWTMQSAYHNLPTINGVMQAAGRRYAARNVRYHADDERAELDLDIASAYPATAQVQSWERHVQLTRGQDIAIVDAFTLRAVAGETTENLLTPRAPSLGPPGTILLPNDRAGGGQASAVKLTFEAAKLAPTLETIAIDDPRLKRVWGPRLYRVVLRATNPSLQDRWTLRVALAP